MSPVESTHGANSAHVVFFVSRYVLCFSTVPTLCATTPYWRVQMGAFTPCEWWTVHFYPCMRIGSPFITSDSSHYRPLDQVNVSDPRGNTVSLRWELPLLARSVNLCPVLYRTNRTQLDAIDLLHTTGCSENECNIETLPTASCTPLCQNREKGPVLLFLK